MPAVSLKGNDMRNNLAVGLREMLLVVLLEQLKELIGGYLVDKS